LVQELSKDYDYSARFNGGIISENTVLPNGKSLKIMPTGIVNKRPTAMIGNGVVLHSGAFLHDIQALEENDIDIEKRILVSNR
jgi:adenylosuccinate synthase